MGHIGLDGLARVRRARDAALLGGVSVLALMVGSATADARSALSNYGSIAPTVAAQQAAAAAAQQAGAAAAQAQSSLSRAAAALAAAQRLQGAAAAAASAASVPNGLVTGGLVPTDPTFSTSLWTGANAPVQTNNGSQVTVDIQQTQQKAVLYWNSFNIGANTTVNFQQQASNWIALNRVNNATSPSQILGNINALGAVYLINSNGIIFGAGSQVNVNTLVASSLDVGLLGSPLVARDSYFINLGIANPNSFSFYDWATQGSATSNAVAGDITVQRGARITANIATDLVTQGSPGDIYLFGANVYNSGWLSAPTGEIGMLAARTVELVPNGYSALPTTVLGGVPFRGTEFQLSQFADSYHSSGYAGSYPYLAGTGAVVHDGLIEASRGIVIMDGDKVTIDNPRDASGNPLTDATTGALVQGVISVDTSIDRNSFVMLRAATAVTLNGVITSLPYDDGSSLPTGGSSGSSVQSFTPPYIEMTAQSTVTMGPSALISAPSAVVALRALDLGDASIYQPSTTDTLFDYVNNNGAPNTNTSSVPQSVLLSPGSVIDVAGLENVTLPASYNFISFQAFNEFADMPVQRNGPLYGQTLWIDIRESGTRSDGTNWSGTPLANTGDDVAAVGRSIYQLMTTGGSVTLQTDLNTNNGGGRVKTTGSVINVAGGSESFQAGWVPATLLLGADGRIYDMATADPNTVYVGIANQFTVDHSRWGVTETWSTQTYSPAYSQGEPAGSVSVTTINPNLQGTIYFGSVAGQLQISSGQLPYQGALSLSTPSSVEIGSSPSADYTSQSPVTTLSADTLSGYGLSSLSVDAIDLVVSGGSNLNLAPGGSFSVQAGGAIDIAGKVAAAGGSITLTTDRHQWAASPQFSAFTTTYPTNGSGKTLAANIYVEGALDVSGRFVNDTGATAGNLVGPAYINGGTINIATNTVSNAGLQDWTGSILLAKGSLLDVSSGGYISAQGKAKTASSGVMAGEAGSVSLSIYNGYSFKPATSIQDRNDLTTPTVGPVANIELDGSLRGYGFQSNGSLTLSGVDNIQIGGSLPSGATSNILIGGARVPLPASLFTDGGFGSYTIQSVTDGWTGPNNTGSPANITIAAGVNLTLQQRNLASALDYTQVATGTKLGQSAAPALETLPTDKRQPVNLTLNADHILLDKGSAIVTDPAAKIAFGDFNFSMENGSPISAPASTAQLLGSITDHSGSVFINATATQLGPQALIDLSGTFVANPEFGLQGGPLTSGTYVPGGTFTVEAGAYTAPTSSQLIKNDYYGAPSTLSYLVALSGAQVDVSGAAGTVQVAGSRGASSSVLSWSDAGTVAADVAGFAWGGSFAAAGGSSRANNGTIILAGGAISLSKDATAILPVLSNFQQGTSPPGIYVAASQLAAFDNVYLYAGAAPGGAARVFTDLNGNIDLYGFGSPGFSTLAIQGSVNLDVANRLHIAAANIYALTGSSNIHLMAPYVELTGGTGSVGTASSTLTSTLTIKGQTIDIEGAAFSGFSKVKFVAGGDIRLGTIKVVDGGSTTTGVPFDAPSFAGSLTSAGNLVFKAQRIYPISDVSFTITAGFSNAPATVKFKAPAGANTAIPLSAGGGIDVVANTIVQAGNLFAPLGQITLGNTVSTTATSIITQSVALAPGSLTSVTLADTIVPFGATLDGTNWYYNASLDPLTAPPSKGVVLAASTVSVTQGSTIDLRGGGDLQAMEWIQGKGGTRDTLTTTPLGQTVYALVPVNEAVAAYDIDFATSRSFDNGATVTPGDTNPLVGSQIRIAGGGGIAAGTYTLYPAHYATLPGAMRVVYDGSNIGHNVPSGTTLTDGTVLVTGTYTQSTNPAKQSSGQALFAVQTSKVWQSYSEYQFTSANSYFRSLEAKSGNIIPAPLDAGSLQAIVLQSFNLNGTILAQPGEDSSGNIGYGSELDISSPQMIAVVGDAQFASGNTPAGYLALDVSQIDNAGFDSVLIGGLRDQTGQIITPASAGILVDTRGQAFTAPEILLVATPATTTASPSSNPTPVANTGMVTIAAGSVISTTGTVNERKGRTYYFGGLPGAAAYGVATAVGGQLVGGAVSGANANASGLAAALQSYVQNTTGAMFVASSDTTLNAQGPTGAPLTVSFSSGGSVVLQADAGKVVIDPAASITANSLTLQATASTGAIVFDAGNTSNLHVGQLNLTAQTVGLGSPTPVNTESLELYNWEFADVGGLGVKALTSTIMIYGDFNPGSSVNGLTLDAAVLVNANAANGGSATISVGSGAITLQSSGSATAPIAPIANGQSTLNFIADGITIGNPTLTSAETILGFANANFIAAERILIAGPGSLTLGTKSDAANLEIKTPLVLVSGATGTNAGSFSVSTGGSLSVLDTIPQIGFGAQPADSADVGGSLALTAANVTVGTAIQAQAGTITLEATAGDVTLLPRTNLDARGYAKTLVDVTSYIAGGKVVLTSDAGNVNASAYSVIEVSQPAGGLGYGGELDVTALKGTATLSGVMFGGGGPGHGGTFKLDTLGAVDLGHYVVTDASGNQSIAYGLQPLQPGQSESYQYGLADRLLFGGFTGSISIQTQTGNIVLAQGRTLKANSITLTADDPTWDTNYPTWNPSDPGQLGQVQIYGTLDASGYGSTTLDGVGEAGGQVALYGANAVLLGSFGTIDASTTHADQLGGNVTVGIGWSAQSKIYLQAFTQIDVSGGTKGGLSGGTVTFIAPRDGNNDMKIAGLYPGTAIEMPAIGGMIGNKAAVAISGARAVTFDGYVAFDTTSSNSQYGLGGQNLGWYGYIDPLGWYGSNGQLVTSGTWSDVSGWVISGITGPSPGFNAASFTTSLQALFQGNFLPFQTAIPISNSGASGATLNLQYGVSQFIPAGNPGIPNNTSNVSVTFANPTSSSCTTTTCSAATGLASIDASGNISITITNAGSGYIAPPTSAIFSYGGHMYTVQAGTTTVQFGLAPVTIPASYLKIVSSQIGNLTSGSPAPSSGTFNVSFGNTYSGGTATFTEGFGSGNYSDQGGVVSFLNPTVIPFQSSGVFSPFNPATQNTPGSAIFTGNGQDSSFFATTLAQVTQGTWSYNGRNYGFDNLFNRLDPLVSQLGAAVVRVQPGVQLVNSSSQSVNSGNITVANNWNLAAATAYNLQQTTNPVTDQTFQYYDPASSYVGLNYRLVTPWGNVEAGALTVRAAGNINVDASISDGFFQFGNYLGANYDAWVASYVPSDSRSFSNEYTYFLNSYLAGSPVPVAPYNSLANAISPSSQDLAAADLFPNSLKVCVFACGTSVQELITVTAPSSWSYSFTAGADLASANPTARSSTGDVNLNNHGSYYQPVLVPPSSSGSNAWTSQNVTVNLPTMVRTGTGNITIAAAGNVVMQDTTAPGVIYAAGVNAPLLPSANYTTTAGGSVVAGNPDGFLEPQVLAYDSGGIKNNTAYYGPPTASAFPEMGGNVLVDAQRDVIGYSGSGNKVPQYYQPWLLADSDLTPVQSLVAAGSVPLFGEGVFAPSGSLIASQTAWWIQYSSFQQGILSGGGNVSVVAGRDIVDVSVSLPTTGRVSGGLSATSMPVTILYGSGNMVVRAGRNILGGSFYEGSGNASIFARGNIGQNGSDSRTTASGSLQLPDLPLLAVDTGTIEMAALGSLTVAGVVNPAALQAQSPSLANPLEGQTVTPYLPLYMDTYGPQSGVSLVAVTGDLTIAIAPTAISSNTGIGAFPATYPASLQALALNGNLITTGIQTVSNTSLVGYQIPMPGIVLSPSDHGLFELVAQDSVDLTFGFPSDTTTLLPSTPRPYISAGSALIDTGFDPFQPNGGFDGSSPGSLLAHADDAAAGIDATARIYAVTGSIKTTGNYGKSIDHDASVSYQIIQINRPTEIYAGTDIIDLNIIIQNIQSSDVSTITAGRNINYTGYQNGGGIQVAGPGFLVVQAGGDIGPFLPSNVDNKSAAQVQEGIASVGNASATPVGDLYVSPSLSALQHSVGIYDQTLFGPITNPRRNTQLTAAAGTSQGADVVVLFGVKSAPDYQAVIDSYINPATAGSDLNYELNVGGLQTYLAQLGYNTADPQTALTIFEQLSPSLQLAFIDKVLLGQSDLLAPGDHAATDSQSAWAIFQLLPKNLQNVLVDQVFFDILKDVGKAAPTTTTCPQVCQPAWQVINTLFPSGHTIGAGELDLLHATIQTRLGGGVSIFGPGGDIVVGSLSTEPNPNLRLRDLGILSLGGGDINTYTDGNVLVNSSRILTTQGGDILMWTSYGDLNAGRGSKTIVSSPVLEVEFDQNDYETTDPGGYVTGSGIGTLQASSTAPVGNLYLVAPNGTIDFGTAGVRSSGNAVFVAPVISNSSNVQVAGTATGVFSIPSLSASVSQSANTSGQVKPTEDLTQSGRSEQASVFIVEVIGYGGGQSGAESTTQQNEDLQQGTDQAPGSQKRKPAQ